MSRTTPPANAVYSGTKGAVDAITGVLAKELAPRGIRVNGVNPGYVVTEGTQDAGIVGSDLADAAIAHTPLGRSGETRDIAPVVAFLASDDARWLTGECIIASGGMR